jgi:hypothetical protein
MKKYDTKTTARYEVFSANMTMDTQADMYFGSNLSACKSCQCNCRLCLGGRAPADAEISCKAEAESVLEKLLAA